jgi:Cys-Gly metallodipeptidase DUG1
MSDLENFQKYVDANADSFIERLSKAIAIPSYIPSPPTLREPLIQVCRVSCDASYRKHVFTMADFIKGELDALGVTVRLVPLGKHLLDGQEIDLPPAILASVGNDPKKKTVGLYAHYDVQPVSPAPSGLCATELFPMTFVYSPDCARTIHSMNVSQ